MLCDKRILLESGLPYTLKIEITKLTTLTKESSLIKESLIEH
jgi:hypothetical protein